MNPEQRRLERDHDIALGGLDHIMLSFLDRLEPLTIDGMVEARSPMWRRWLSIALGDHRIQILYGL
jgi:hypothetical protein